MKSFQYNEKFCQKKDSLAYEFGRFYLILAYELGKKYCKKCFNSLKIILLYSFYRLSPQDDGENHYFCIRIIQTMFEYIFYRLNHAYKKHEPNTNHGFSASIALSVFQFFVVGGILIVLNGCFGIFNVPKDSIFGKIIALGFMALLILYNYKHYTPKIEKMDEKYANFPINKWLKDWLFFFLFILISLSFLFIPALLFGHLMK